MSLFKEQIKTEIDRFYGLFNSFSNEIRNLTPRKNTIEDEYFKRARDEIIDSNGCSSAEYSVDDDLISERCSYYCKSDDELETINKKISDLEDGIIRIQHHISVLNILSNEIDKKIEKREKLMDKQWYPQFLKKYLCSRKKISQKDIQDYANAEMQKFVLSLKK